MEPNEPKEPKEQKGSAKHRNALLVYVSVLFGVAFLLILLSFFIQLRNSNETISQLSQSSASAMTSVENLQNSNQALQTEKKDLESQVTDLEAQVEDLQAQLTKAQADLAEVESQLETETAALTAEKKTTQTLSDQLETETARADDQTVKVEALTEKARAYELLIQAENYFRSGYYTSAQEVLDTMDEEGLGSLLDQQAAVLYNSLPDRLYLAQRPSTDSVD